MLQEAYGKFVLPYTVPYISLSPAQPKVARPAGLTILASPRQRFWRLSPASGR